MKHLLVEKELKKLKAFDSSYSIGKSRFGVVGAQNYLVFQPMYRYFKAVAGVGNGSYIYYWQSKGLSDERLNSITASNYKVTSNLNYYGTETRVEFYGSCLKQDKGIFHHGKVVNIYFVYETVKVVNISKYSSNDNYPALKNVLFGAVSLTKNEHINKYKYSGYGTRFDGRLRFSYPSGGDGQNVMIFGVDVSSSTKI